MNCAVHARKPTLWCLARCQYCAISLDEGNLVLYRARQLPTRLPSRAAFASPTKREETFVSSTVEVSMQKKQAKPPLVQFLAHFLSNVQHTVN